MKIKKYPQSCFIIETNNKKILIDAGGLKYQDKFDDGIKRFYTTSDTICFNNNYKCDVVALPITAHGLTMSSYEAALYSKELGAKLVIPVHMDNDFYPTNLNYMKENFEKFDINYKVLEIEKTIEI